MLSVFRFPINLVKQELKNPTENISCRETWGGVGGIFVGFLVTLIVGAAGWGALWGSNNKLKQLVTQTQTNGISRKHIYPVSHLTSPN